MLPSIVNGTGTLLVTVSGYMAMENITRETGVSLPMAAFISMVIGLCYATIRITRGAQKTLDDIQNDLRDLKNGMVETQSKMGSLPCMKPACPDTQRHLRREGDFRS